MLGNQSLQLVLGGTFKLIHLITSLVEVKGRHAVHLTLFRNISTGIHIYLEENHIGVGTETKQTKA
jgi:hypothetical protein